MKTYCNPIDLEYKFQHYGKAAHREAADPTLVHFKDRYYLFASMSAGFYHSEDLVAWTWHENRSLELYLYAPDVRVIGDYLYYCASDRKPTTIWRTTDPMSDQFEKVSTPFAFWDPALFCDDDGRVYLYWGCGNSDPIFGVELDQNTFLPIGEKVPLFDSHTEIHGWERVNFPGKENIDFGGGIILKAILKFLNRKGRPYLEGAFVNKWHDRYYLQYAAPGTEHPVYGDGVYIGSSPLGPFVYQKHNPFSFKPAGFINGAGHGSTIEDIHGNLWHIATMRISVNAAFERRLGIFPAGLDEDGTLFCNQNFADYPIEIPDGRFDIRDIKPAAMLLSYRKKATASSQLAGHGIELALNEDIRTWWCAQGSTGEWFKVDLGKICLIHSIQLNLAEENIPLLIKPKQEHSASILTGKRYIDSSSSLRTRYILQGSQDGQDWFTIQDASAVESDRSHAFLELPEGISARYIKVTAVELAYGQKFAISGLRVFGLDDGTKPDSVFSTAVEKIDTLTAKISWQAAFGATGYNVRYGIAPDKLYTSYLIYEITEVLLTALNEKTDYWYCIDSFNESGITEGSVARLSSGI